MLLKYFNSNRISVIVLISLLPVVYWLVSLFQGTVSQLAEYPGVPFGKMITAFSHNFRFLSSVVALLLVFVNAYLLIQLNTIHIFIPVRTQLPSFFYVMLAIGTNGLHELTPALVSSTLMILIFFRIFNAYKIDGISVNFLDAGLLISCASLIYFPALAFSPLLFAGLIILRPMYWREWVFAFLGLILPYIFLFSFYYLTDIPVSTIFSDISDSFAKVAPDSGRLSSIVSWSYCALFVLISSYFIASTFDTMKIHARKFYLMYLVFFALSVLIYFIFPGAGTGMIYYVSVPLAYLFSHYFIKCKQNWVNDLFFTIYLLLLLWQMVN